MGESRTSHQSKEKHLESSCSICNGTLWIINEKGNATRCECWSKELRIRKDRFATIPDAYKDEKLENINLSMYKKQDSKQLIEKAIKGIRLYISELEENNVGNMGLFLWSDTKGSGKTKTMAAIANLLIKDHQVKFATSLAILNEIRSTYNKDNERTESKLVDDLISTEILIIDDFGTEETKAWSNEKFYHIINERYINKKITMYTSNFDVRTLKYDSRIVNRVIETTYQFHFPEESVREYIAMINDYKMNQMIEGAK